MILRVVIGLVLVLILPGAALTAAIFTGRTLGLEKRILYAIGLSLAVTALSGMVLNLMPLGLQAFTWVAILTLITLVAAALALFRVRERGKFILETMRNVWPLGRRVPAPQQTRGAVRLGLREIGLFGLAGAIILLALGLARLPAPEEGLQGYSTLYLAPSGDGNPNDVRVGVSSYEFADTNFQLQVTLDGKLVQQWNGLALKPGVSWNQVIQLPASHSGASRLEAVLYRLDEPNVVYRHALLIINGARG